MTVADDALVEARPESDTISDAALVAAGSGGRLTFSEFHPPSHLMAVIE